MTDAESSVSGTPVEPEPYSASQPNATTVPWLELVKVVAIPLVTLILGLWFNASLNARQVRDNNLRLYTEMMGRREESDSALRKDMFNSILSTFMSKDPTLRPDEQLELQVLNLELLASNFHESLDLSPLFKHVRKRIPDRQDAPYPAMASRLEKVAREVVGHQLTVLSDTGMVERGDLSLQKVNELQSFIMFGAHTVNDPHVQPGQGVSRMCLSMYSTEGEWHFRQFKVEITRYDPQSREMQVRLYVSRILRPADCQRADLEELGNQEIDTTFELDPFDFPMIDNTHLTHGERCAVSLTQLTPREAKVALAYFPGSRASLKDKPYYDDLVHDLLQDRPFTGHRSDERPAAADLR